MSDLKIAVGGLDYFTEQSTTQFVIPAGAGATFSAAAGVGTVTFNAAHGLTFSPAANVMPNYYIKFGGSTSGLTGTGILVGNVFRILSIPTTSSITIATSITAATVTSLTGIPVFYPVFQSSALSAIANTPPALNTPYLGTVQCLNYTFGANCNAYYNPDNAGPPLDFTVNGGTTPAVAPTYRKMGAASGQGQLRFGPWDYIAADGTTATSYISIVE